MTGKFTENRNVRQCINLIIYRLRKPKYTLGGLILILLSCSLVVRVLYKNEDDTHEIRRTTSPGRYNVLFIAVDDLRPQLGAYRGPDYPAPHDKRQIHTPNLDRLAGKSLLLQRAYTQYSLCGPSRASLLTSRRPDTTKVYKNVVSWRDVGGDFVSIPQYFKENGYEVAGAGKIVHAEKKHDDDVSWTLPYYRARGDGGADGGWRAVPTSDREESPLQDERIVKHVKQNLRRFARSGSKPFFQAVGFMRPHLPHICPAEYFDLYPLEKGDFMANKTWQQPALGQFALAGAQMDRLPERTLKEFRRAYFACVSYVDHLIGELLQSLDDLDLAENTIVSLVADHGFHLGENDWYSKYTSYDISLHVPFILHIPGQTDRGIRSRSLVELLDLFPTLAEASGVGTIDKCPERSRTVRLCTEGASLVPLITDPGSAVRSAAFSQIARGRLGMEYSIKTDKFRYVATALIKRNSWKQNISDHRVIWDHDVKVLMQSPNRLYDHESDPEERFNVIDDPAYAAVVSKLRDQLAEQFPLIRDYPLSVFENF